MSGHATALGSPSGLWEGRDGDGLPVFFDEDGRRLFRNWGSNSISDLQLRHMELKSVVGLSFPVGMFYRHREVSR